MAAATPRRAHARQLTREDDHSSIEQCARNNGGARLEDLVAVDPGSNATVGQVGRISNAIRGIAIAASAALPPSGRDFVGAELRDLCSIAQHALSMPGAGVAFASSCSLAGQQHAARSRPSMPQRYHSAPSASVGESKTRMTAAMITRRMRSRLTRGGSTRKSFGLC
jgi:hypothetical protein